jgi:predicted transcriptional regulator
MSVLGYHALQLHRITESTLVMKTSTLPPLRVSPELRADAESVLAPGESLSSFVHDAVTRTIEYRKVQQDFIERGLASAEKARRTGRYVSSGSALKTLKRQIAQGPSTVQKS